MQFEWDERKAAANIVKHGVSFTLAQEVWDDPLHFVVPSESLITRSAGRRLAWSMAWRCWWLLTPIATAQMTR